MRAVTMVNACRPETRALLVCASVLPAGERRRVLEDVLSGPLDLDLLALIASAHEVAPLLYRDAQTIAARSRVAMALVERLKGNHDFNFRRTTALLFELARLLRVFNAAGIDVIPYKGPSFALRYYDSPGLRPCGDLDLVVHERDVAPAIALLEESGYKVRGEESFANRQLTAHTNEITLDHVDNPLLTTELHWELLTPRLGHVVSQEVIWRESRPGHLRGVPTRVLTPEGDLLVTAVHAGLKHEWMPLRLLGDFARLVHGNPGLDWGIVREALKDRAALWWIQLGIEAATRLLAAGAPPSLCAARPTTASHHAMLAVMIARYGCPESSWPSFREWRAAFNGVTSRRQLPTRRIEEVFLYVRASLTPQYADHLGPIRTTTALTRTRYLRRPLRQLRKHGVKLFHRAAGRPRGRQV